MNSGNLKLGIFVTSAVGLLVVMMLLLGVLQRFKPTVTIETYFSEPIRGLQRGAAVRYRGMRVGSVSQVAIASHAYPIVPDDSDTPESLGRLIMARMAIEQGVLRRSNIEIEPALQEYINNGLRARLSSTGLGGPTFIDIDYVDPRLFPPADLTWKPKNLYLPSAPSAMGSIINDLQTLLVEATQTNLIDNLSDLAGLGPDLKELAQRLEKSEFLTQATSALEELQSASTAADELLRSDRLNSLLTDASQTLGDVRSVIEEGRPAIQDLQVMSTSLTRAADALDGLVATVNDADLIPQLEALANELGPAGRDLSELAQRLNQLIGENSAQITDTVRGLRKAVLDMQALLEEAKANPSGMILGDPPPRRTPGAKP